MSVGFVIANIGGGLREAQSSPAVSNAAVNIAATGSSRQGSSAASASSSANTATAGTSISNQPQLSPSFTIVVLQLLNEQGAVTATIPSAQQLAAYRAGTQTPSNGS